MLFSEDVCSVDCISLLRGAAARRHTLIISDSPNSPWESRQYKNFDNWQTTLSERLQTEVRLLIDRLSIVSANSATMGSPDWLLISNRDWSSLGRGCQIGMQDAIRAVSLPLHVMVENQINDGAFLRLAMPIAWQKKLEQWERNGELRFSQGGGNSELGNLIEYHSDDDRARLAFGLPSKVWKLLHFVIYDHDGTQSNQPGEGAVRLRRICDQYEMKHRNHMLERRTQENYIPLEALSLIVSSRAGDVDRGKMANDVATHFSKGSLRHFEQLPRIGKDPFFKNEFSKNHDWLPWKIEWFQSDGSWIEMRWLAEKIAMSM